MDESQIFAAALSRDPVEREQYLQTICEGKPELLERMRRLLAAHDDPDSYLDRPLDIPRSDDGGRERIGPYKLLQRIGEGGMGTVYMAEQTEPVQRRVALKVIKPGMDTREVIARFEAERQALALMDHPGIAKVLDAGTTPEGRPYFVMELVHGQPITTYCDERHLDTKARLELFAAVCRAVQHAHQKGVIHRDLKPSNILVAEYDHEAVPKVIDFGVAKAMNRQLTGKTLFTEFGQIIGTLDYMSPEQAKQNQLDVDTRSDIYSLGIVLYELLTGDTPFDKERLRSAALDEMLKIIREEEPPRPSQKLSGSRRLSQVAANRGVEPRRLTSLVSGDLDWIVLKSLAKERGQRYTSAHELAEDVTRHLNQQPVLAGPPRPIARLGKFVRRNRGSVMLAGALAVSALAAWWLVAQQRAQEAARQAVLAAERQERSAMASAALEQASLDLGQAIHATRGHEVVWAAARASRERVRDWVAGGELDADILRRIRSFNQRFDQAASDRQLAEQIMNVVIYGATHPDLASWEKMERDLHALFLDRGLDLDEDDPAEVAAEIREDPRAANWVDALELWIATRGHMSSLGGPVATAENMQPWADAMYAADTDPVRTGIRRLVYAGRPPTSEEVYAVAAKADLDAMSPRGLSWLGNVFILAGEMEQAERIYAKALDRFPDDIMMNFDIGLIMHNLGRPQEAIRMYSRCLVLRQDVAGIWQSMGLSLQRVGELDNARDALERACDLEPDYAPTWSNLGELHLERGAPAEAREAAERALSLDPESAAALGVLGRAWMEEGDLDRALELLEDCHLLGKRTRGWNQPSAEWLAECRKRINERDG